jgi:hypothetical protein
MKEVYGFFASPRINGIEVHSIRLRERAEVFKSFLISHIALILLVRGANNLEDDS